MRDTIYDPKTGLHYKLMDDYYIPLVKAPDPPNIGIWGHQRYDCLIHQLATAEGITEDLKATSQMEWVARMNIIYFRVTEIVNTELIFL